MAGGPGAAELAAATAAIDFHTLSCRTFKLQFELHMVAIWLRHHLGLSLVGSLEAMPERMVALERSVKALRQCWQTETIQLSVGDPIVTLQQLWSHYGARAGKHYVDPDRSCSSQQAPFGSALCFNLGHQRAEKYGRAHEDLSKVAHSVSAKQYLCCMIKSTSRIGPQLRNLKNCRSL